MVLQVFADPLQFMKQVNSEGGKHICATDAREFQYFRAVYRPGGQDNLTGIGDTRHPFICKINTRHLSPVQRQPFRLSTGQDTEILAMHDGF